MTLQMNLLIAGVAILCFVALVFVPWDEETIVESSRLQYAIDDCTGDVDNMGQSGRSLESCLDDAYNQYGSEEQKQNWFDDEH